MIVYPAVDIRQGRVVRLFHGDPNIESVYSHKPVEVAVRWKAAGAAWLHVINLDGAFGEDNLALDTLREIAKAGLPVQFGGGLRHLDAARQALQAGAARVILGTLVVNQPELAAEAVRRFGAEAVVVALDARGDQVTTHGWRETSQWSPVELGQRFAADGVKYALYTDVNKDGDLSGANIEATAALAEATGLHVIASGGVARLDDIRSLKATGHIAGVIIGRALYAGLFSLEDALLAAGEDSA
jgi:phosphoribosylformimino-5-aminoimidazole carboxamide ribotide isomerase